MVSSWLAELERTLAEGGEGELPVALVNLASVAGRELEIPDAERRAAGRRALLLLAAGGDPARGLDLDGRAVTALAAELETPERVAAFQAGLAGLRLEARSLPHVREALLHLEEAPALAWQAYAAAILAEELDAD